MAQGRAEGKGLGVTGHSENTTQSSFYGPVQACFCLTGALDSLGMANRA